MHRVFITVILMVALASFSRNEDITAAEAAGPSKCMDERQTAKICYRVAKGYTIVDEPGRTFFIDYDAGVLYNLSKEADVCRRFSLSHLGQKDDFAIAQLENFAELTFHKETQQNGKQLRNYATYTVVNNPRAMLHRGVVLPAFKQFGVSFTPGLTEYRIDLKHGDFEQLLETVQYNAKATSGLNPLIYQLDISHLLTRFGGVPLSKAKKGEVSSFCFYLSQKKALVELLPPGCADL